MGPGDRAERDDAGDPPDRVHGMSGDLVRPDWPPLTAAEMAPVLTRYPSLVPAAARATVLWSSPRPMSAAGLVRCGDRTVFVKRHDRRVRTAADLAVEHAFGRHLSDRGVPVPAVLLTWEGAGAVTDGERVYEVHQPAPGVDLYRDVMSWAPFRSRDHAHAAGAALARLHLAAEDFGRPARRFGPLTYSAEILTAPDPAGALARRAAARPGLGGYLSGRRWRDDLALHLAGPLRRARAAMTGLRPQWAHGDWHPSNLSWTSEGAGAGVAGVFDLGLANRTAAVHDLAMALERSVVGWLELSRTGRVDVDLDAAAALLAGYRSARPLSPAEGAALEILLPVVHVEFALSEVEYFHSITGSAVNADLAYDGYLIGHARWFAGPGSAMLEAVGRLARKG